MPELQSESDDLPSLATRIYLGLVAMALMLVFAAATWLKPDPRGFGTHQQLGLPPCSFQQSLGIPCPHCGMTTSFSHLVQGNLKLAAEANPMGIPLAFLFLFGMFWCTAVSVRGRWLMTNQPFSWLVIAAIGYLSLALLCWVLKILF